jgi:hypothetical protein
MAAGAVRALLNDPDPAVRVAAVEAAAEVRSIVYHHWTARIAEVVVAEPRLFVNTARYS